MVSGPHPVLCPRAATVSALVKSLRVPCSLPGATVSAWSKGAAFNARSQGGLPCPVHMKAFNPESLTPSRKARGLNSSRTEPSLNFSGVEYFRKICFTVFYCICNRSAIRMKHCSAMSNMRSSSLNFSSSEPGPPDIKRRFSSPSEVAKDCSLSPDLRLEWRSPSWLRVLPEL